MLSCAGEVGVIRGEIGVLMGWAGAEKTAVHGKRRWWMFGPKGNHVAASLFSMAMLQEHEGARLRVMA